METCSASHRDRFDDMNDVVEDLKASTATLKDRLAVIDQNRYGKCQQPTSTANRKSGSASKVGASLSGALRLY